MVSKKLAILGGTAGTTAAAGGTGAAIYLNSGIDREEGENKGEHATEAPNQEKNTTEETGETGPGRDIVKVHEWLKLDEKVGKISEENKCKSLGWEWKESKCKVSEEISKFSHLGIEAMEGKTNEADCISAGGNWWWENEENKCKTRDIILREKFKKSLNSWEVIEKSAVEGKITGDNRESLVHLNAEGNWEIKKYENDYVVIFPENKLSQDQKSKNWEFPSYYNISGKSPAKVSDICSMLESLAGGKEGKNLYLYNENKKTFWDCKMGGYVFVSY